MIPKLEKPVLVLNKNWTVIGTTPLYKAINLLLTTDKEGKKKAHIIDEEYVPRTWEQWSEIRPKNDDDSIRTPNSVFKIPEIIKLSKYGKMPRESVIFSRHNIFRRDDYKCQYCGVRPGSEELTIDHIIPKCKGGKTTWENCVLACTRCNSIKGDFELEKVKNSKFPRGMKLLREPFKPKVKDFKMVIMYESWKAFLDGMYWNCELENDNS